MLLISKEQFLEEHNKLSPANLQANLVLLERFQQEKKPLLKDDEWCLEKLRMPFMAWLAGLPEEEKKAPGKHRKTKIEQTIFRNYPETHYEA
jgi:hypothetical protein